MKLTYTLMLSAFCIASQPAQANINIVFDYRYDSGFFTGAGNTSRQTLLNAAASVFESRFTDSLTEIKSSGGNQFNLNFDNPSNTHTTVSPFYNTTLSYDIAADKIVVFVGAYNLGSNVLGEGGPGGYSASGTQTFLDNAASRGQKGAPGVPGPDFGPWGGTLSFNNSNTVNYYFGTDAPPAGTTGFDFYSVAVHELGHLLGFGTANSYYHYVANGVFTGPAVNTLAPNPSVTNDGHWAAGTKYLEQEAAMTPGIAAGQRKNFTELDFAAMKDIGWQVTAVPEPETWGMLLAGLGLLGWRIRCRTGKTVTNQATASRPATHWDAPYPLFAG